MMNWIQKNPFLSVVIIAAAAAGVYVLFFRNKKSPGDIKVSDLVIPENPEITVNTVPNFVANTNPVPAVHTGTMSSSGGTMGAGGTAGGGARVGGAGKGGAH